VRQGDQPKAGVNWWPRLRSGSVEAYAFAILCVAIATLIRWALGLISQEVSPLPTYYPAVLFAALVGGMGAGTIATVVGGIFGWWAFMPPAFTFFPLTFGQQISLLTYLLSCLLIVWGADHYRKLTKRLEDEEKFRTLTVEELAHRLKNKLATIQSIVSYQLRDNPQIRDNIVARLAALSATDDLILATQGRGAGIRDILVFELGPYEASRVSTKGPDIFLPPKLALTMALLFHELATNAAKYGALSCQAGRLSICWSLSDATLDLEWQESGGPSVIRTAHRGFGMRLMSRALDQFDGAVETTFETTGLKCKMRLILSEDAPSIVPSTTLEGASAKN
jgi:two-component sensor histidine kinase